MRTRTGSVVKRKKGGKVTWWARVTFVDRRTGKRRDIQRRAENKAHARELAAMLAREIEQTDGRSATHREKTFADLADHFSAHYLRPAEYVDGRKVRGLRSLDTVQRQMHVLRNHFGRMRVREITYDDLSSYRADRLNAPTRTGGQRAIASVHRELALLRRVLSVALRAGWIIENPFDRGESLISPADERQRERILTREEEARLLAACNGHPARQHLRSILICALDTGMRQGEIFKLRWRDVDFEARTITVQGMNTKTLRSRTVAMTARLEREMRGLRECAPGDPELSVFGVTDNVKRSFGAARRTAGLPDLRFHDLRHTAATRLVQGNMPLAEAGRILGHTQPRTTYRYVNANADTAQRAAAILDSFHEESAQEETAPVN